MFKGSQKAQTYKRRYKRTCTRYHKSQCLWCWEHGLMGLPLEEVIFLYRHCQTWLLSCLRNHSEAQAGFWKGITWHLQNFPRAEHSKGLSCRVVWRTNTHWLLSAVEMEVFCQCLAFLTISAMIICALALAEESTFWRFSLNGDSFIAGYWIQLSGHVMSVCSCIWTFAFLIIYLFLVQLENV